MPITIRFRHPALVACVLVLPALARLDAQPPAKLRDRSIEISKPTKNGIHTLDNYQQGPMVGELNSVGKLVGINPQTVSGFLNHPDFTMTQAGTTTDQPNGGPEWKIKFGGLKAKTGYSMTVDSRGPSGFFTATVSPFELQAPNGKETVETMRVNLQPVGVNQFLEVTRPRENGRKINIAYQDHFICRGLNDLRGQSVIGYIEPKKIICSDPVPILVGRTLENGHQWAILFEGLKKLSAGKGSDGRKYEIVIRSADNYHAAVRRIVIRNEP
jgi:hypothetical protein